MFEPEEEVTLEMAAKIMVNALGYNYPALENGGYPFGFLTQAQKIGLLVGVDQSVTPLTRKEIALMAHNALDIDMMIKSVGEADEYQVVKGETLRNRFRTSQDIQKYTGIVTATIDTYLDTPVSDLSDNEIEPPVYGLVRQARLLYASVRRFCVPTVGSAADFTRCREILHGAHKQKRFFRMESKTAVQSVRRVRQF